MSKEEYIQRKLEDHFRLWLQRAALWGCFLFVVLAGLDYLATPENFPHFLKYRAIVSVLLISGFFITRRIPGKYLSALAFLLVAGCAFAVENMILRFGGHESPYAAGMLLLAISVVGFIPARFLFHLTITLVIYAIYVVPIASMETISAHRDFLILNVFMLLIFSTMLLMRYLVGKALVAELGLQYDLEQYRGHLEAVAEERTADLRDAVDKLKQEIVERQKADEERQRLQMQLLQAQKMESVGRLAGGVAHDFNNLLTAILSYAELSLMRVPGDDPIRGYLESIQGASEKAAGLTQQLLAFSRKQVLEMKVIDLNTVIAGMADMLRRLIGEDILLEIRSGVLAGGVRADRGRLEQVLMNLAVNARDAMPKGGRLTIETRNCLPEEAVTPAGEGGKPEDCVMLTVTDTGCGMSAGVRDRVFEPFFTTKDLGKGTGLGLSTVYGIIKQHSGNIDVESRTGYGTTFRIFLPLARGAQEDEELAAGAPPARGTETILVVEDDQAVRGLISEVLQPLGYRIVSTATGDEAVRASDALNGNIDLLLTDVVMPGMNGIQLAERLRMKRPGIKVLFMTGYTQDALSTQGMLQPGNALIHKPLRPRTLARHVRRVLDSGA